MKNLYDITEGILDDEDEILATANKAASLVAAGAWLNQHGASGCEQVAKRQGDRGYSHYFKDKKPESGIWNLEYDDIYIDKKDKTIPEFVKIFKVRSLNIQGYLGETLPFPELEEAKYVSIRNCPNLKSLDGCPITAKRFAVSGCPKLTSLEGAPKQVTELFQAINNGKEFTDKDIKRVCNVPKKNMIY